MRKETGTVTAELLGLPPGRCIPLPSSSGGGGGQCPHREKSCVAKLQFRCHGCHLQSSRKAVRVWPLAATPGPLYFRAESALSSLCLNFSDP